MTVKNLKNAAISIRQKLLNKANAENRTFNEVLQYYCMERFLYRLSVSPHADKFILKGALILGNIMWIILFVVLVKLITNKTTHVQIAVLINDVSENRMFLAAIDRPI